MSYLAQPNMTNAKELLQTAGKVDTRNSTTTPIDDGITYTGKWSRCEQYSQFSVLVSADQSGILYIEFSTDGINTDITKTVTFTTDTVNTFTIVSKYMRVRVTNNSGTNQTSMRVQTIFHTFKNKELNVLNNERIPHTYDSLSVRPTHYHYEVALGKRENATTWNKFGYNADVDTGSNEILAAFGGTWFPLMTASTLTIVSSSTDDDSVGIGAQSVILYGVDANRENQIEVVALNGTTNVVTTSTWLGLNRVAIYIAGSSYSNVGNITVTATTGGTTQAYVPAGVGTTQQLIFFTQAGHTVLMDWLLINAEKASGSTPTVTFKGWVYSAVSNSKYEVFRTKMDTAVQNNLELRPSQPFVVGEKSVLWLEATTTSNGTEVSARGSLIEVKN